MTSCLSVQLKTNLFLAKIALTFNRFGSSSSETALYRLCISRWFCTNVLEKRIFQSARVEIDWFSIQ